LLNVDGMRRVLSAAAVVSLATGCYATARVPATEVAAIRGPLAAPKKLAGATKLAPNTAIRARRADGSVTPWLPASGLAVADEGLVSGRRYPLAAATEVTIAKGAPAAAEILAATAPPAAFVDATDGELRLRASDPRVLLPWLASYATGAAALHQQPGWVSFRGPRDAWVSDFVPALRFAGVAPPDLYKLEVAEGVPWRDVVGLELHNLDPIRTAFGIVGMPIAMSLMMLSAVGTVAAVADGDDPTPALALGVGVDKVTRQAIDPDAGPGGAPVRPPGNEEPGVLVSADGTAGALAVRPLFSPEARRRDSFKLIVAGDGGLSGDGSTLTASAGVGLRLGDFVELTVRMRALAFDDTPLLMRGPSYTTPTNFLFGGRLALHIDGDGDARTAFVVGGEVLGGSLADGASLTELAFVLGPRFAITNKTFASLLLAPSLLVQRGSPYDASTTGQVMLSLELGFDL
jgi:hypothetical protein